jgi:hypothetical protein
MGIMHSVDSPNIGDYALDDNREEEHSEKHGTRSTPSEAPTFVDLFLHRTNHTMNTTNSQVIPNVSSSDIIFTLQDPLINDFLIQDPIVGFGMMVNLRLSGTDTLTIEVRDNSVTGPLVGTATHNLVNANPSIEEIIYIPFETGWNHNYTFSTSHVIVIDFDFQFNTGQLHYDSVNRISWLRLYGITIPDISLTISDFYKVPKDIFYPNDIDFPDERKKVIIDGVVTEIFGKEGDIQYIDQIQVQIEGPGYDQNWSAIYNKNTYEYIYTWNYPYGQTPGEYIITIHVFDEQSNEFTITGSFNMSEYGVLLTSPFQDPEEGHYIAVAKRKVIQYTTTVYKINVRNIGIADTIVNLTTIGELGWDWWLEGQNLTKNEGSKNDTVLIIAPGDKREILLYVDSTDRSLGEKTTVMITAECTENPTEISLLETLTAVIYLPLFPGWNLISIPFVNFNTEINSVFSGISGDYDAVQWFNISETSDPWKHHHTSKPPRLNDLNNIDHTTGIWIHITDSGGVSYSFPGTPPTENQTLALKPGWNHVGYPSLTSRNRTSALNNITFGSEVDAIWSFNSANKNWKEINGGDYFEVGVGYWIHATKECEWEVPL